MFGWAVTKAKVATPAMLPASHRQPAPKPERPTPTQCGHEAPASAPVPSATPARAM